MDARLLAVTTAVAALGGCAIPLIGAPSSPPLAEPPTSRTGAAPRLPQDSGTCYRELSLAGVAFEEVARDAARGVVMPTRLSGPIGGIEVRAHRASAVHEVLDCRLALALLRWSPALRRAGVVGIEHYSIYRPGARTARRRRPSGHAFGLAIDAARFRLRDGEVLDVLTDWEDRSRGADPCPRRRDEAYGSRVLRGVVCDAVSANLFQVVLTPHHDRAHDNHVHLELKPGVDWTYVR